MENETKTELEFKFLELEEKKRQNEIDNKLGFLNILRFTLEAEVPYHNEALSETKYIPALSEEARDRVEKILIRKLQEYDRQ